MNNKIEKAPVDPELRRRVQELIAFKGGGHNEDAVTDIASSVSFACVCLSLRK